MRYKYNEIDLHIHTVDSDGKCTGRQIIEKAHEKGIKVLSVTDHNFFAVNSEVKELAEKYEMILIPGIEFTVFFESSFFHMMAYFNDKHADKLNHLLAKYNRMKYKKVIEIMKKLKEEKILFSTEKVAEFGRLSFKNIARTLVLEGYADSYDEAMEKYVDNEQFFNCKVGLPLTEVVETIHSIGGIVSLAHPFQSFLDEQSLKSMIDRLAGMGLDGIEIYNGKDANNKTDVLRELAARYNLIETGGSDFHGSEEEHGLGIQENIAFDQDTVFWESLLG